MSYLKFVGLCSLFIVKTAAAGEAPIKFIPKVPANCASVVAEQGYCTETLFPAGGFPFSIRFFIVVDKDKFPDSPSLLAKYFKFSDWPAYARSNGSDNVIFNKSQAMEDKADENGSIIIRQYYEYKLKSPIGYQKIRGITHNQQLIIPYEGALASTEFAAQTNGPQEVPANEKPLNGAEGLKYQTGSLHLVACDTSKLCSDEQWLVIYESTITPSINLLPKVVSASVEKGLADVIIGMLFN